METNLQKAAKEKYPYPKETVPFNVLEKIAHQREAFIAGMQARGDEWVSVEDRLPVSGYLVMAFNGFSHQIYLGSYLGHSETWIFHGQERGNITHWMPLPSPPKI